MMINVEQRLFLHWGAPFNPDGDFDVKQVGDSLIVAGWPWFSGKVESSRWDLFENYRRAPRNWSSGHTGKNSPHIQFANAETDQQLIAFVTRFGPVVAESVREVSGITDNSVSPPTLLASQNMNELRNERSLYRSVMILLSELEREQRADLGKLRHCIADIVDRVRAWPSQCKRESHSNDFYGPIWRFDEAASQRIESYYKILSMGHLNLVNRIAGKVVSKPLAAAARSGHDIICELINAFPTWVYRGGATPIEGPHWDLRYGTRPVLYYILRREYVDRAGIAMCANTQCRKLFQLDRTGKRFCDSECSRHQRQRDYWATKGKNRRKKRILKQKKSAKNQRS